MIHFVIAVALYFLFVNKFFDKSVAPIGKKLQKDIIPFPRDAISIYALLSSCIFPMLAIVKARDGNWETSESLGFSAVVLGVVLGMTVNIH